VTVDFTSGGNVSVTPKEGAASTDCCCFNNKPTFCNNNLMTQLYMCGFPENAGDYPKKSPSNPYGWEDIVPVDRCIRVLVFGPVVQVGGTVTGMEFPRLIMRVAKGCGGRRKPDGTWQSADILPFWQGRPVVWRSVTGNGEEFVCVNYNPVTHFKQFSDFDADACQYWQPLIMEECRNAVWEFLSADNDIPEGTPVTVCIPVKIWKWYTSRINPVTFLTDEVWLGIAKLLVTVDLFLDADYEKPGYEYVFPSAPPDRCVFKD